MRAERSWKGRAPLILEFQTAEGWGLSQALEGEEDPGCCLLANTPSHLPLAPVEGSSRAGFGGRGEGGRAALPFQVTPHLVTPEALRDVSGRLSAAESSGLAGVWKRNAT